LEWIEKFFKGDEVKFSVDGMIEAMFICALAVINFLAW
jgi:hypothetical protein